NNRSHYWVGISVVAFCEGRSTVYIRQTQGPHFKQSVRVLSGGELTLMVLSGSILFLSEGTGSLNEIENIPLLVVFGLTIIVLPITEFFYAKKYK
ncbi:hypothetical protein J9303_02840, partial [Bacillaceae bacterium Marseille-Q3522]|nr:hypothetical protein [Bacillaceae bacterium Marseille-Q3522]